MEQRGELDVSISAIENKLILKKAVEHKTSQILEKAFISEREVYDLVRGFFKKYIGVDYEFTSTELLNELRKVYISPELQERIKLLFARVSEMEHVSREFSRKELETMLSEFKSIVDALIVTHYEANSKLKQWWHWIHQRITRKHEVLLEKGLSALNQEERIIVKMNILIDNSKRLSEKDPEQAKKIYSDLLSLYSGLDDNKKKAYFEPINQLYNLIKSKSS